MTEPPVDFVGGPPAPPAPPSLPTLRGRSRRQAAAMAAALVVGVALVALGVVGLARDRGLALPFTAAEPAAARAFTQALHRVDPAGMRAQVTATCLADSKSSLCFGPESDAQFRTALQGHTLNLTFLRRYEALAGTVVLYDLVVRNQSTGVRDDLVLILRLAHNGKIDHALVS